MGTRHLVMVKLGGKLKVAQYGQWDGYPTGQGETIAKFLQSKTFNLASFKKEVAKLEWASDAHIKKTWIECGAAPDSDMVNMKVADAHTAKYPEFSRDTGAGILELIAKGQAKKVQDTSDFLKDGLFCEFAYEIDLTKKVVNVYNGGKKPAKTVPFKDFTVKRMKSLQK